ncbi:MAG: AmmeMemoRadiSam system protein B [Nanoarchaeota archaeon]|nr:AmmeMemoRadiSam system protein B [Nanoarchaeota archaeon]MBU1269282.1 AmmeMemoRadiSam system protein B [Nanoarchaeota archaeon]MBU1603781.1 AmmeMemoRadiSam system protein B [Nanoarchaeota archaeon]MBU2443906.1 AmmeMemoRadiSam system protein B [Nanoarchaeota archaeon]
MRKAQFAGTFYEHLESRLKAQLESCFLGERGPGSLPNVKADKKVKAIIVPHAGYAYSGACAAWAYKALAESKMPDLFILIGPSHHSHESGFSLETFETPLGMVRVKQDFAIKLAEKGTIKQNEAIHQKEHSLEVQLPFLQFVFQKHAEKIKILPILISQDVDLAKLAVDLKETIVDMGITVTYIISSDFTHFGPNYRYVPFSSDVKNKIYDLDANAIEFIKKLESNEFVKYVNETFATICGTLPIALLLKTLKPSKVSLEQYYTSGDVVGSYKNSVSYASIVFT